MLIYLLFLIGICIAGNCDGASEIRSGISVSFTGSERKTEDHKQSALQILRWYKDWLNDFSNRQSFKAQHRDVSGFLWSGSMLQNRGLANNGVQTFMDEIERYGMPEEIYMEFLHGNALQSWGIILTSKGLEAAQTAVKKWSCGQGYDRKDASKSTGEISICYLDYNNRKHEGNDEESGECFYNKLEGNPTGNVGEYLIAFNPSLDFTRLQRGQPYCYSEGKLPNLKPKMRDDGKCAFYKAVSGDTCSGIGAQYGLSVNDIENYNKKTYGWKGCGLLQIGQSVCLSEGKPQRPTPNPKAECGPFAPGEWDEPPECPNKACCSEFGFCGLTEEFCDDKKCYSNCGVPDKLPSSKANDFKSTAYIMNGKNIYGYHIVHYSFAEINDDLNIKDIKFPNTDGKRVIALGGWELSTSPSTYQIFRRGVSDAYREKFAHNIADFIKDYDGVNFDWEYPEAPDIPGIPAGIKGDGHRYYQLLKRVKELAPDKLVSVAIPASYWYLKGFPLKELNNVVDYFVLMNYDYVGQWDYGKPNTGIGCHMDRTLTEKAIKMLVKSGIDTTKVYGGLANYGRAFELVDRNCRHYGCGFTGPESSVPAGENTKTPGFLSMEEINKLNFWETNFNPDSKCFYGMWGVKNWVAWMHQSDIDYTEEWYRDSLGLGGSALWAYDYYDDNYKVDYELDYYDLDYDLDYEIKECSYNENASEDSDDMTCYRENIVSYYIKELENAKNNLVKLKNDKNYESYYQAYVRAYYDGMMEKYEDWMLKDNRENFMKYFTFVGKKIKRDYSNDTEIENSNVTVLLRPDVSVVLEKDKSMYVETSKLDNFMDSVKHFVKRAGRIQEDGGWVYPLYRITESIIKDEDKEEAVKSLREKAQININPDVFVTSTNDKEFEYMVNGRSVTHKFEKSTILNRAKLVPNSMENITDDTIVSIEAAIKTTKEAIGKEYILDVYDVLDGFLMYIDINNSAQNIYDEGKIQKKNYEKRKKLLILNIVLGVLGLLTVILGPVGLLVADVTIMLAGLIATNEINGNLTPEDVAEAMAGILGGLFSVIKTEKLFAKILKVVNKEKGYNELKIFPTIRKARNGIYGKTCI